MRSPLGGIGRRRSVQEQQPLLCADSDEGCVGPLFCDLFNGASERPAAPVEADDNRHDSASGCTLQQTRERWGPARLKEVPWLLPFDERGHAPQAGAYASGC